MVCFKQIYEIGPSIALVRMRNVQLACFMGKALCSEPELCSNQGSPQVFSKLCGMLDPHFFMFGRSTLN